MMGGLCMIAGGDVLLEHNTLQNSIIHIRCSASETHSVAWVHRLTECRVAFPRIVQGATEAGVLESES